MNTKMNPFRTCLAASATGLLALATVLPAQADYSSTVLSYNPAAYWRLNETTPVPIADQAVNLGSAGAAANGFYKGTAGATYDHPTPGVLSADGAATLAGVSAGNGLVVAPYSSALLDHKTFTAEGWFKPTTLAGNQAAFSFCNFTTYRQGIILYCGSGFGNSWNLRLYNDTSAPIGNITAAGSMTVGAWHHVVVTCDGTNANLYVNGVLGATTTTNAAPGATPYAPPKAGGLFIGARSSGSGDYNFQGSVDEFAFYTNVLSASTIAAHYQAGTSDSATYATTILASNPVGYYRLNEAVWSFPASLPTVANSGSLAPSADGTCQPGMVLGTAGPGYPGLGSATSAQFFGITGWINCGINITGLVDPTITNTTLMAWFKMPAAKTMNYQTLLSCGDDAWVISRGGSGNNGFEVQWNGQNPRLLTTRTINDDQWHHVAVVASSNNVLSIYIDGRLDTSGVRTVGSRAEATYPILIGNNGKYAGTVNDRAWSGGISDVAVFTSALTASDISSIYGAALQVPTVVAAASISPTNNTFEGAALTLNVAADGSSPLAYQWRKNGISISGATTPGYLLTANAAVSDSGTYSVVITNTYGAVTSSVVLTVTGSAPIVFTQPASVTTYVGNTATFSVVAGGSLPRSYVWKKGVTPVGGATTDTLILTNVQWTDAGSYTCTITNVYGSTNTTAATLTVAGEFSGAVLPDTGPRDRHSSLGSDGTNLYFTRGSTVNNTFFSMRNGSTNGWTTLTSIPNDAVDQAGPGDMCYFDGAMWMVCKDTAFNNMVIFRYDIAGDSWTKGTGSFTDGSSGLAVLATNYVMAGWAGEWHPRITTNDWETGGYITSSPDLTAGAAWPWDSCIGLGTDTNVYFIKHYNTAAHAGILAAIPKTRTGAPVATQIAGMPFNPGGGCAIEFMPGSLFPKDNHARLYVLRGGIGTGDNDGKGWNAETTSGQLAIYDLVSKTWELQTLPFAVDLGSEMCLVNQTLYILAATSDASPLKALNLVPETPTIVQQPVSQSVYLGQSATFNVSVSGGGPYGYQWRHDTNTILGANSASYTVAVASYPDSGNYSVVVTNAAGSVTSQAAALSVLSLPTFANLTNNLVLHLTFDSDLVTDSSSRGNNATVGGLPSPVPGKLGNAVQLSTDVGGGTYNFLQVYDPNSDFQWEATDSFTIAFWLKYTNSFTDLPIIGNAINSTYNDGFVLTENANQFEWTLTTPSGGGQVVADPAGGPLLNNGTWHQVTLVCGP